MESLALRPDNRCCIRVGLSHRVVGGYHPSWFLGNRFLSKYFYGALALSSLGLIALTGCKKGSNTASVSGNLGTVNGEPITDEQFYNYLQRKPVIFAAVQGRQVQVQVADTIGIQTMRDLVQQKLLLEIAKEEGVLPSKDEVDKELALRQKQNATYISGLQHAGLSLDEIRQDILLSLASEKIETKGVTVTPDEAKKYISQNQKSFSSPAQAKLLVIVVKGDADKTKADADLKTGQSFAAVAMKYSTVPHARENGGAYPQTVIAEMPKLLQSLVASTPEDKATPWEKDSDNWVKFFVSSKTPAKPMAITSDLVTAVQRELAKKKSPNGPDFQRRLLSKIQSAKVDLSIPFYQESWTQYAVTSANAAAHSVGAPPKR
jgi:parvulin-like peptidyl-prolyl isomerase